MQPSDLNPEWVRHAKVGDKVVCILPLAPDEKPGIAILDPFIAPEVGRIYTIRSIEEIVDGKIGMLFEEIPDQLIRLSMHGVVRAMDLYFQSYCFRPVQPRQTDISQFTAMLDVTPAKAPEAVPA